MLARSGLGLLALAQADVGVWGEASPRGFFDHFPGLLGQHWVNMFGAYNEHLVRDFAAAELGFAVLLTAAAIWFERRLVLAATASFAIFTAAHFAYHLTTTAMMSSTADALSLGAFAVELAIATAVAVSVTPRPAPRPIPERSLDVPPVARRAARP